MSRQCPSCNKLCSFETQEPESEVDVDETMVSWTIRLVRNSVCCGEEMKETTFEGSVELDVEKEGENVHTDKEGALLEEHELSVEVEDEQLTERSEGKGRGMKSFYGVEVTYKVTCSCGVDVAEPTGNIKDECQASCFDEV